jgi:hypothetical protein
MRRYWVCIAVLRMRFARDWEMTKLSMRDFIDLGDKTRRDISAVT